MITPAQLIRRVFYEKKGFTLIEVLVATTIFTIVGLLGVTIFVNVMRVQRRITLENAIYEDGRFMMERISREIRQNTIDYEEYYREANKDAKKHGQEFGCYAQQFMNLGTGLPAYGTLCNDMATLAKNSPGCIIAKDTQDINTGQNPATAPLIRADDANAMCGAQRGWINTQCRIGAAGYGDFFTAGQLYLINAHGTEKTYLGMKKVGSSPDEYSVAMLMLEGTDTDNDGISEQWVDTTPGVLYENNCMEGFDCDGVEVPDLNANLAGNDELYEGFVPLTPLRTNITSLTFYVSPLEDPRKAFSETVTGDAMQQQPHITVVRMGRSLKSRFLYLPPEWIPYSVQLFWFWHLNMSLF